jgi:hypothetical protein
MIYALNLYDIIVGQEDAYRQYLLQTTSFAGRAQYSCAGLAARTPTATSIYRTASTQR